MQFDVFRILIQYKLLDFCKGLKGDKSILFYFSVKNNVLVQMARNQINHKVVLCHVAFMHILMCEHSVVKSY